MNVGVYIGRFQPFHNGHRDVLDKAFESFDHIVIVVGSSNAAPTIKNPWSFELRAAMIRGSLHPFEQSRISIVPVQDYLYNESGWISEVQFCVWKVLGGKAMESNTNIKLICPRKDASSYYLDNFPSWENFEVAIDRRVNATDLRMLMFNDWHLGGSAVPPAVSAMIKAWMEASDFERLQREFRAYEEEKEAWKDSPFPVTINCADAVVIYKNRIAIIVRGGDIGNGLLALPGGHIDYSDDSFMDAAERELKEETGLNASSFITSDFRTKVFDHPDRNPVTRVFSNAFYYEVLDMDGEVMYPNDDATGAFWMPLELLPRLRDQFHADHYEIIQHFLNGNT